MDTFIWGPPMWKVLHTLSFSPPDELRKHKQHVINFLDSLKDVLPCIYCRNSYGVFITELPPLDSVIDNGELSRWMYDLHSKVNAKLEVKDPEYSRVQKRFTIRPKQWCPQDVWDLIALFGINYSVEKSQMYRKWWENFIPVLGVSGADPVMLELMGGVTCPCENGEFVATSMVLSSTYNKSRCFNSSEAVELTRKYGLAKAKKCSKGTCK